MTHRSKRPPKPRYHQTYPSTLATTEELRVLGLCPGTREPDAILDYHHGNKSGICGLFDRSQAVPARPADDEAS
ncbi:hypothetical protein HNQ07_004054 [Deinococcus metalli]|uniref:Uncharacterized protein n=1 Tax=Deinococcus metalli TaxID=1141878 RepID=A0A7W8NTT5_9DEIO|nr:hypothetical protein [Deinococcus metalli]MBB5378547.1 hypothetical protein [Deinococcus metalli]GHF58498.1 hypothetical protein GCM10017781_38480 [Deinococcus metalli]